MNRSSKLCAGMGHETKKPWMLSAPMARTASSSVGSSSPFDRHLDAHAMAQLDDRIYERAVERFPVDVLDEQAVDLTMSAGDWASRAKRRVTGAEIVHGDADADGAQTVERGARASMSVTK